MAHRFLRPLFPAAFLVLLSRPARAQDPSSMGTEFWLSYMENIDLGMNGSPYLYLVASSNVSTQGELQVPATGDAFPFTVEAGHASIVFVPSNFLYPIGAETYYDDGLRIVADDPINLFAYHHRMYFSEATLVLPTEQLGTDYLVTTQLDMIAQFPCEFVVLATQDSTAVEITPSEVTASLRPADVPFTITLMRGEAFQLQAYGELTGSRVRSLDATKPVAVFGGSKESRLDCMDATDHVYTQLMPLSAAKSSYTIVPYKDRGGDIFRIMALHDGTNVNISNGVSLSLDSAEFVDQLLSVPARITANEPVSVVQFNQSQGCNNGALGDGCMAFVPPTDHMRSHVIFNAITGPGGLTDGWTPDHTLNIWTASASGTIVMTLDGADISASFLPIPNVPDHWYAQLDIVAGEHVLTGNTRFQAQASGFGSYNSYSFFTGFHPDDVTTGISVPDGSMRPARTVVVRDELPMTLLGINDGTVFSMFDAVGRTVLQRRVRPNEILDLRTVHSGLYTFRLQGPRQDRTGRLFIEH